MTDAAITVDTTPTTVEVAVPAPIEISVQSIVGLPGPTGATGAQGIPGDNIAASIGPTAPATPVDGQLWFDSDASITADGTLAVVSATEPATPGTNDLWYDSTVEILKRYDGAGWVFPTPSGGGDWEQIWAPPIDDISEFVRAGNIDWTVASNEITNTNTGSGYQFANCPDSQVNRTFGMAIEAEIWPIAHGGGAAADAYAGILVSGFDTGNYAAWGVRRAYTNGALTLAFFGRSEAGTFYYTSVTSGSVGGSLNTAWTRLRFANIGGQITGWHDYWPTSSWIPTRSPTVVGTNPMYSPGKDLYLGLVSYNMQVKFRNIKAHQLTSSTPVPPGWENY